jgi:putative aldouronate transport system permease protein
LNNYLEIFKSDLLLLAFRNSVLRTVVGTITGVLCCAMVGYTVSRKDFVARRWFSLMLAITMYVSGGLIPDYILIRNLGLFNSFLVYILPALVSVWNVFVIRSYIDGLPDALQESARIDGANDLVIFFRIILPLCLPVLATVALFTAVGQWNSWFDTYLFNNSNKSLTTLQYELQKILTYASVQFSAADDIRSIEQMQKKIVVTPDSLKMAMTIVTIVPILFVYPFVQRYFVTGMTLGAVKS